MKKKQANKKTFLELELELYLLYFIIQPQQKQYTSF